MSRLEKVKTFTDGNNVKDNEVKEIIKGFENKPVKVKCDDCDYETANIVEMMLHDREIHMFTLDEITNKKQEKLGTYKGHIDNLLKKAKHLESALKKNNIKF